MYVDRMDLDQFRSYEHLELDIPAQGLRIVGRNGSGKSSLLEALVMLATTRSPRTQLDREVVGWQSGADLGVNAYARLQAGVHLAAGREVVAIGMELDANRLLTARKSYTIGGDPKRAHDLIGVLKCVLFSPEDVAMVTGAPAARRREVDILISQTDRAYLRGLATFGKVLAQRNQLLRQFSRERRSHRDAGAVTEISFWDDQMISSGAVVVAYRQAVAAVLGAEVRRRALNLVDGADLDFTYVPRLELPPVDHPGDVDRATPVVAAAYERQLQAAREQEFRRGMSLVGPHRDDFVFQIAGRDLGAFGSRGQQRLGVIAFKFASIEMIAARTNELPVLLLDDVLSELDATHRQMLLDELTGRGCQIMVTSTDPELLDQPSIASLPMIEVAQGKVLPGEAGEDTDATVDQEGTADAGSGHRR
jgi:DNA replication and repair protein RecF